MSEKTYNVNGVNKFTSELTIADITEMINNYIRLGGDLSSTCFKPCNNLPSVSVVRNIVKKEGYTLLQFLNTFDAYKHNYTFFDKKDYDKYVGKYKNISQNQTVPLQGYNLKKYNLPCQNWFIKNCPDPSVDSWIKFTMWCGFIPNNRNKIILDNKKLIGEKIIQYEKELQRPLEQHDIRLDTVGFSHYAITELWGSISNCRKELGLMECVQHPFKTWDYYDTKMQIALKNMYDAIQTTEFTWKDWQKHKKIPITRENFIRACNREKINVDEYFENLGFKVANRNGSGCNHIFEDGELCVSNLEYRFSTFLRENNIKYKRNIKYSTFDESLEGRNFNCDYVIECKYWIEICGMTKANADNWKEKHGHTKLEKDYYTKMILKDESLTKHSISHLFLFKKDFDDNTFITKTLEFINA